MIRLAIDAREALSAKRTGKGQWAYGFLRELSERADTEVIAVTDKESEAVWPGLTVRVIDQSGWRWHRAVSQWLTKERPADLYVSPTSYIVPALVGPRFPCVPVVHDLIAFRNEPHERRAQLIERLTLGRTLRHAAHVCTISEATKSDLLARYPSLSPENVSTIFAGPQRASPPLSVSDGKTILCIGTLCPRKNQLQLIKAFTSLPENIRSAHRLILVGGRGWNDEEIVRLAAGTPCVEWKGYVSTEEYEKLLSAAHVFAFPSLYEGFGLAVLDALACGVPVLTSDRGSLKEVTGDCAVIVDPLSTESIAMGLLRLLTDATLQQELRIRGPLQAKRFSWKNTVDLFLRSVQ